VRISTQSDAGFTLIEVMVAMLITLVGLLGLLNAVNMATEHNLKNQLRDEAALIAEQWMANLKARGFSQISGVGGTTPFSSRVVNSKIRSGKTVYTVDRPCSNLGSGGSTAQLTVKVTWYNKGQQFNHSITSIRSDVSP
jgi:type IV pilus assembly protein PilV